MNADDRNSLDLVPGELEESFQIAVASGEAPSGVSYTAADVARAVREAECGGSE